MLRVCEEMRVAELALVLESGLLALLLTRVHGSQWQAEQVLMVELCY